MLMEAYVFISYVNHNSIADLRISEVGGSDPEIMCGNRFGKMYNVRYSSMLTKHEFQHSGCKNIFV